MATDTDFQNLIYRKPPWGVYCAKLFDNQNSSAYSYNSIPDLTRKQYPAIIKNGDIQNIISYSTINGYGANEPIPVLTGSTNTNITFPEGSVSARLTVCSITKYIQLLAGNALPYYNIITSNTRDFIHGHNNRRKGYVKYGSGTELYIGSSNNISRWVVTCSKNPNVASVNNVLVDGEAVGSSTIVPAALTSSYMGINIGDAEYFSTYSFSYLLIWDQILTDNEMKIVSDILQQYLIDGIELTRFNFNANSLSFQNLLYTKPPWGVYCANTYINNSIPDLTGKQYSAVTSGTGTISKTTASGEGATATISYLSGGTNTVITFPNGSIPSNFTVCSITRYSSSASNRRRILTSADDTFIHGHSNGIKGYANYNGELNNVNYGVLSDWLIMCGKNPNTASKTNILVNGIESANDTITPTSVSSSQMGININSSNMSDYRFAYLLIWDQILSDNEMLTVSNVLTQYLYDGVELYTKFNFNANGVAFRNLIYKKPPWGVYSANTYNNIDKTIPDLTGKQYSAVTSGIENITKLSDDGATATISYLSGDTNTFIAFPNGSIPSNFTVCSITRYSASSSSFRRRILTSVDDTFIHGHDNGARGYAKYGTQVLRDTSVGVSSEWLVMCGKNPNIASKTNILINGVESGNDTITPTSVSSSQMGININSSNMSDYRFAYLLIWDQNLTDNEMLIVSNTLSQYLYDGVELYDLYSFNTYNLFQSLIYSKPPYSVYCASSYNSVTSSIPDVMGKQADAIITGSITQKTVLGNGAVSPVNSLEGTTDTRIVWPSRSWPNKFTMCSITRYTENISSNKAILNAGTNAGKIYTHGHASSNQRGYVYYNAVDSPTGSIAPVVERAKTDWLVTCGKSGGSIPNNILIDGIASGINTVTTVTSITPLNINLVDVLKSSFAFSHILIWDQELTDTEMKTVSDVLIQYLSDGVELYDRYFYKTAFSKLLTSKIPWGIYCADSYTVSTSVNTSGEIPDLLNRRNSVICSGVTLTRGSGNGATSSIPFLKGTTTSKMTWPNNSIPSRFTICSITRYNNTINQTRILQSTNNEPWVHGHNSTKSGVALYNNRYITQNLLSQNTYSGESSREWLVMCSKNTGTIPENTVFVNGLPCGTQIAGVLSSDLTLCINNVTNYNSDFEFSHVLIWDQELTDTEMRTVSFVLSKYLEDGIELKTQFYNAIPTLEQLFSNLLYTKPPWGVYCASSFDSTNNIIRDLTGISGNAVCSTVSYNVPIAATNGEQTPIPYLSGGTSSSITWPVNSISTTFTICSITRYSQVNNQKRILQNSAGTVVHGHNNGTRGYINYDGGSQSTNYGVKTDWLVMCGKNAGDSGTYNNILVDGILLNTTSVTTGTVGSLIINKSGDTNNSDFQFSHVLIWDYALSASDMVIVNNVLRQYLIDGIELKHKYTFSKSIEPSTSSALLSTIPPTIPFSTSLLTNMITRFNELIYRKPPWGVYCASSFNSNAIPDLMGKQFDASCSGVSSVSDSGNGSIASIPYLTGTTSGKIIWPSYSIPKEFTICSTTRYTNLTNRKNILTGFANPARWIHGHNNGYIGVARYQIGAIGTFTNVAYPSDTNSSTDWFVMCGKSHGIKPNNFLVNGIPSGNNTGENDNSGNLAINSLQLTGNSDFAFANVLIWDQELEDEEMALVSNVLRQYLYDGVELSDRYLFQNAPKYDDRINRDFCNILESKPPIGIYCASEFSSADNTIKDLLGGTFNAVCSNVASATAPIENGANVPIKYLYGSSTNGSILWPANSIAPKNTVCAITRYNSDNVESSEMRIISADGNLDWLVGHNQCRGQVYYNTAYMTPNAPTPVTSAIGKRKDWLVTCAKTGGKSPTNVLLDGVPSGTNTVSSVSSGRIAINKYTGGGATITQKSDFAFSHLLYWDQELTDSEMKTVSDVLQQYLYDGVELSTRYSAYLNAAIKTNTEKQFESLLYRKPPWGIYCASSYKSITNVTGTIADLMGKQPNADVVASDPNRLHYTTDLPNTNGASAQIPSINGSYVNINSKTSIYFPYGSIPTRYTICSITRYTYIASESRRILTNVSADSNDMNWFHGHNVTLKGVIGYSNNQNDLTYNTPLSSIDNTNNWLVMCGKTRGTVPTNILADGTMRGESVITNTSSVHKIRMGINVYKTPSNTHTYSYFGFSHVLIWDQELTDSEMKIVSNILQQYLIDGIELKTKYTDFFTNQYRENENAKFVRLVNSKPPLGIYCANSYNSTHKVIPDLYRRMSPAKCNQCALTNGSGNGSTASIPHLTGTTASTIIFPENSLPEKNTVFSITRYTSMSSTTQKRILTSNSLNNIPPFNASYSCRYSRTDVITTSNANIPNTLTITTAQTAPLYQYIFVIKPNNVVCVKLNVQFVLKFAPYDNTALTYNSKNLWSAQSLPNNQSQYTYRIWYSLQSIKYQLYKKNSGDVYNIFGDIKEQDLRTIDEKELEKSFLAGSVSDVRISASITDDILINLYLVGNEISDDTYFIEITELKLNTVNCNNITTSEDTGVTIVNNNITIQRSVFEWRHGHYLGKRGVAAYNTTFVTQDENTGTATDWLVMSGKTGGELPTNVLVDGGARGVAIQQTNIPNGQISINTYLNETSEFAFSHLLIWDQELTDDEMVTVSNILRQYLNDGVELSTKFAELFDIQSQFRNLLYTKPPFSIYLADSYTSNQLPDLMNKQGPVTCVNVTKNDQTVGTNGTYATIPMLTGTTTTSKFTWPSGSCPSQFTMCSLTRYTSTDIAKQKHIITSGLQYSQDQDNITTFAHGHLNGAKAKIQYSGSERTTTNKTLNLNTTDWLVCCASSGSNHSSQLNQACIFADGINLTSESIFNSLCVGGIQLGINTLSGSVSDFAFSSLIVWDTNLSVNEMITVNRAFQNYLYDGVSLLSYAINTRPYNVNYTYNSNNVLNSFPYKNIAIPYSGSVNYYTTYSPSPNIIKMNEPIVNQLTPYVCGSTVLTNYKINGKDIGNIFQRERLSRANRIYISQTLSGSSSTGISSSTVLVENNYLSYPIWIDSAHYSSADVTIRMPVEPVYFYTIYNSQTILQNCYIKYYADDVIDYIKINNIEKNKSLPYRQIISGSSLGESRDSGNTFVLNTGTNYIMIKSTNTTYSGRNAAYIQVDFYDSANNFLFGTNAETWYASRNEYTINIP